MSTRTERQDNKALNDKHTKILKELMMQSDNRKCSDCRKRDPRWASWNLGIFFCIRCSGIHRSLGTHISKDLYWEHDWPRDMEPPESNIDQFIRAKYERKQYCMKGPIPDPDTLGVGNTRKDVAVAWHERTDACSTSFPKFASFASIPSQSIQPLHASQLPSGSASLFSSNISAVAPQPATMKVGLGSGMSPLTNQPTMTPTNAFGDFSNFSSSNSAAVPPMQTSRSSFSDFGGFQSVPATQRIVDLPSNPVSTHAAPPTQKSSGIPDFAGFSIPSNGSSVPNASFSVSKPILETHLLHEIQLRMNGLHSNEAILLLHVCLLGLSIHIQQY
ncbi:hypothetical protein BSLG_006031 [Batrachochytrium salamandrivorans]|nr:hypothetical protein BSLG_006031 [Batrachochytrium salamandrivorans]